MKRKAILCLAVALLLLAGSLTVMSQEMPLNFCRIVVVGDSLSAGYYNGSLHKFGQMNAYDVLFAQQAYDPYQCEADLNGKVPDQPPNMVMPYISYPGMPVALVLKGFDPVTGLPIIEEVQGEMGSRIDIFTQNTNIAVPGQTSLDCLTKVPNSTPSEITDIILGFPWVYVNQNSPLSQAELAPCLDPDFVILWIGGNDVLGGALMGNPAYTIPSSYFATIFPAIVSYVSNNGTIPVVIANIPDVGSIPAMTKGSWLKKHGIPIKKLGITKRDFVTPYSHEHIKAIMEGNDSGPLAPDEVLTREELTTIRSIILDDNQIIKDTADAFGYPVVNIHKFFNNIKKHGYILPNGQKLTAKFLGGIFGLDGVHPTQIGQAVVANRFITKVNHFYGTNIPAVDLTQITTAKVQSEDTGHETVLPCIPTSALAPLVKKPSLPSLEELKKQIELMESTRAESSCSQPN